ncbi:hypothetical protein PCANC_03723 [Puccinia coronata f. sp. avenae]|uniref:Uncharacterized protein n=1 Tax=Puccinia coronata f. sp. avenae TaxID=200324 RepID=A0A2N5VXU9_9BASI|nr:hypothetical protein PCANC_03723 [Puccinia coronata f. sp. avenae]
MAEEAVARVTRRVRSLNTLNTLQGQGAEEPLQTQTPRQAESRPAESQGGVSTGAGGNPKSAAVTPSTDAPNRVVIPGGESTTVVGVVESVAIEPASEDIVEGPMINVVAPTGQGQVANAQDNVPDVYRNVLSAANVVVTEAPTKSVAPKLDIDQLWDKISESITKGDREVKPKTASQLEYINGAIPNHFDVGFAPSSRGARTAVFERWLDRHCQTKAPAGGSDRPVQSVPGTGRTGPAGTSRTNLSNQLP